MIVVADRLPEAVVGGEALALDVHVVSDVRDALDGVTVEATLSWPADSYTWRWQGDVPPDDCVRVGTVQAVVPKALGPLTLDLTLTHPRAAATNRYVARIDAS